MGMVVTSFMFFNALVVIPANYMLYHYITSENHKAKYRKIAFGMILSGTLLLSISIILYGVGMSWGYFSCVLVVVFQAIILSLFSFVRTGEERNDAELEEAKIAKQLGLEPGYGTSANDALGGAAGQMLPSTGGAQFGAGFAQPQAC